MEDKKEPNQSRTSEIQILELRKDMDLCRAKINKDLDHSQYKLDDLEKEFEFIKTHFTTKNSERLDDITKIHTRLDKHIQTELEYHQGIRDKATTEHTAIHKRIGQAERWIWIFFGGITAIGALLGKSSFTSLFN